MSSKNLTVSYDEAIVPAAEQNNPEELDNLEGANVPKKSKDLHKNAESIAQIIIKVLRSFIILFSGRFRKHPRCDFIMPPWILRRPPQKRRPRRVISTLIRSRQAPKLRLKDVRKVIKGRTNPTFEIRTEGSRISPAMLLLRKFKT